MSKVLKTRPGYIYDPVEQTLDVITPAGLTVTDAQATAILAEYGAQVVGVYVDTGGIPPVVSPFTLPSGSAMDGSTVLTAASGATLFESVGLSSGTLTTLDGRYAVAGSAVGARLASASLATGATLAALGAALVDIPGMVISPVIGSRGVDLDVSLPVIQSTASNTFVIALIDVTAGNVQVDQTITSILSSGWGTPVSIKCDVAPAAGARTYKLQAKCISGTVDVSFYGANTNTRAALTCTQR